MISLSNLTEFVNDTRKLITFSSGAEIHKLNTYYGLSKKICTNLVKDKRNIKNLRIYNAFGELGMTDSFVYLTIQRCLNDEDVIIWNDHLFDTYYVNNIIDLIVLLINNNSSTYEEINCVYEKKYRLSEIALLIKQMCHSKSNIIIDETTASSGYCGQFKEYPGLQLTELEPGLMNMIEHIK